MGRIQLALRVSDVDAAVDFYTKVFATPPAKRRPGYANFAIAEPPLKLVLIEGEGGGNLDHLGVELEDTASVTATGEAFTDRGLITTEEQAVECCYAAQDKVFVTDPDGMEWEFYTVLSDAPAMAKKTAETATACC